MRDKDQQSAAFDLSITTTLLKGLRVDINTTIDDAKKIADERIQRGLGGRELSLCITNLQQARMWAGEALGVLGHQLPEEYRDSAKPGKIQAVQFDPQKHPWPDGVVSWDTMPYRPRDMSRGYIDTPEGRIHVQAHDWIIVETNGAKHVAKPSQEREKR